MTVVSPLHSEEGRNLLDTIDKLRLLPSISHEIALPQIVVVGQQSSGKSSVLKAISNIDFPTNSGFCTQFATEIICRREPKVSTRVSIIPSAPLDAAYRARLDAFHQRWSDISTDQDLSVIIESAGPVMGLNNHRRIARDKLRLEFSGPKQDHISLIDLPGLFEQKLPGQREEDKGLVDDMVREYISGDQTIILAVVSGAYDLQVQRIFQMFEPYRSRALGVITAPDMVESGTARAATFQQLVMNSSFKAGHEWHVLRNLSHREEAEGEDRDEVEQRFFAHRSSTPNDVWRNVPEVRLGIHNLKAKLATLLQKSIIDGLPHIQRKLRNAHESCAQELALLGDERITSDQQRDYLADRSERLRAQTTKELRGDSGPSLRSLIRNANDAFADNMIAFGEYWKFVGSGSNPQGNSREASPNGEDFIVDPPISISDTEWLKIMLDEISHSRGRELDCLVDPVWVGRMFLRQSRKWKTLAEIHLEETYMIVQQYFVEAIEDVVGPEDATRFLLHSIYPELEKRNRALKAKLEELLTPYNTEHIRTLKRSFRTQQSDLTSILAAGNDKKLGTRNMIAYYTTVMIEFYHLALNVFVDNIESLAIENVLLGGLENILTATKAHKMNEEQLAALASESDDVTLKRRSLQARARDYEEGIRIISHFSLRGSRRFAGPQKHGSVAPTATPEIIIDSGSDDTVLPSVEQLGKTTPARKVRSTDNSPRRNDRDQSTGASSRGTSVASPIFDDDDPESDLEGEKLSSASSSLNSSPLKNNPSPTFKFGSYGTTFNTNPFSTKR